MDRFSIFVLIYNFLFFTLVSSKSPASLTNFQISKNFGHNLTEPINQLLHEVNTSKHKNVIKEALAWSPVVYYETDILLNNIDDIIPVIDLLNELKPEGATNPKFLLSLNYLNTTNGQFMWRRMADVYYDLNTSISEPARNKIISTLISIAVNFISPVQWRRDLAYYGNYPSKVHFTKYVKDFTNLHFGKNSFPVGLIYSDKFPSEYQPQHIFPTDFLIYFKEIDLVWDFPMFMDQFSEYMEKALSNTHKNVAVFVKDYANVPKTYIWNQSKYYTNTRDIGGVNEAAFGTKQNKNTTQKFVTKLYERAGPLFNYIVLSWASIKNRNIIFANVMQNISSEIFVINNTRSKLILPDVQMEGETGDPCGIKDLFLKYSKSYETILLDEQIWRELSRFQMDFQNNLLICNETANFISHPKSLKVMMHFTDETTSNWIHMEEYMSNLIDLYPTLAPLHLDTIIFTDQRLKSSIKIQKFANSTKLRHKIGCSIHFNAVKSILYQASSGNNKSENYFKSRLENKLCSPVFYLLDVMIWLAPEYGKTGALFSYYSDIFLAREIFLGHFPNITVLIQLAPNSNLDKRILADLYNVPIVIPSNEILL